VAEDDHWTCVGNVSDFPQEGGATVKVGHRQIAVFNFASRGQWYACQNMCPHKQQFVLSGGLIGDQNGVPKVACPLHKKTFSLESGECLTGDDYQVSVFPVKVEGDQVYVSAPNDLSIASPGEHGCHALGGCHLSNCQT